MCRFRAFCRFKKDTERIEYIEAMKTLFPLLYERMMAILADQSIPSVTLQHSILKIFYATMQVCACVFSDSYVCIAAFTSTNGCG